VQDLIDGFARRNRISGQVRGVLVTPLAPDAETALYRVVQEALSNVGKHAEATAVDVELHDLGDSVELTVADDGRGFRQTPANALLQDGHFGLVGMRERLEAAGGLLTIDSEPGTGTRLTAHVPRQRTAGPAEPAVAAGGTA
jgi:signal transduction histidine kinase